MEGGGLRALFVDIRKTVRYVSEKEQSDRSVRATETTLRFMNAHLIHRTEHNGKRCCPTDTLGVSG